MTKDPLILATPDRHRELFDRISKASDGFSVDDVLGAAATVMINAIRQSQPTQQGAEKRFDELFGRTKQVLMDHYDSLGRKRGIFPYPQTFEMPKIDFRSKS